MTELQAVRKSIAHWERMRAWVRKQPGREWIDRIDMMQAIGEDWYAGSCPLCEYWGLAKHCEQCVISRVSFKCTSFQSVWMAVDMTHSWRAWLKASRGMIAVLRKCNRYLIVQEQMEGKK